MANLQKKGQSSEDNHTPIPFTPEKGQPARPRGEACHVIPKGRDTHNDFELAIDN